MNYQKIGLKGGLEIHQQLDTGKLFCRCPSFLRKDEPHFSVQRKLHKVSGETGEVDAAVQYEDSLKKTFEYQGYADTTCLIELDEEPPKELNYNALAEAIKISLLLNCKIYPASQIMRKIVIDGSNTSGFQRTVLVAHDGFLETEFGKVPIETVALEEDACRIISRDESKSVYRLDRLGIPLVEITTSPAMSSPDQIKEAALKLGEILRVCNVKRGIGTIRQDVNVNIKGHSKVEIKGFQDPTMMVETIDTEIKRQQENILKNKTSGEVRNALPDGKTSFLRPLPGKARMYPETDLPLLKISRQQIDSLKKALPKMKDEIRAILKKKGLNQELISLVEDYLGEFEVLMKVYSKDATLVAKMITIWRSEIASKHKKSLDEVRDIISERVLEKILEKVSEAKLSPGDVRKVMEKIYSGEEIESALKSDNASEDNIEEEVNRLLKDKPGLTTGGYMGLLMSKFKGKLDGKKASEILAKYLK